jgi:hypothetical protein
MRVGLTNKVNGKPTTINLESETPEELELLQSLEGCDTVLSISARSWGLTAVLVLGVNE